MAACKKEKCVKRKEEPIGKRIGQTESPEKFYSLHPSWRFSSCDPEKWTFKKENIEKWFWDEILTWFSNMEKQFWSEVLVRDNKKNHYIDVSSLNKCAQKRLQELKIEQEAVVSLRLTGKHRFYGIINEGVFCIIWFDDDHGDNDTCVCRSKKKGS